MLLFFLLLLGVFTLSGAIVLWMELSITNDRLRWLEERLTKLEKDAVKVTFSEPPFTTYNEKIVFHPEVKKKSNPKQFDGVESDKPFVKTRKRKPKTTKDWEDEFDLGGHE